MIKSDFCDVCDMMILLLLILQVAQLFHLTLSTPNPQNCNYGLFVQRNGRDYGNLVLV